MVSFRQAEQASMKALQDRREQTRKDFFKGRKDVSPGRLDRRQIQKDLYDQFKQQQMKLVPGTSNLYQSITPGGPTLADKAQQLAFQYGPTPRELLGDAKYAIQSIAKGLAEKGTPLISLGKDIVGGIQNFFSPKPPVATYGGTSDISIREVPLTTSDLNISVDPGASPEFLAAINAPGTMAQDSRLQELLMKNVPGYKKIMGLGNTPYGKFGIENLLQGDPRFTYELPLGPGQFGIKVNPYQQSGGFSYGMQFKNGGIATLH